MCVCLHVCVINQWFNIHMYSAVYVIQSSIAC